ncbi:DUF3667 domain-containing protein [Litorimonas haliclonae]|uniref:DUF3667 domain-containing protein n=1 Tax=Litorimonas haliclonae TaxID=2081977 RepID=UPI0039EE26FA
MNSNSSETIEFEALLATSVLDRDKVPNQNQSETCFSCGSKITGLYCKDCGQKNDDYRRSIFSLAKDGVASVFSLDSRMWQTWFALLLKPGRVAREFANGKRTKWSSPVRIYLAMSLLLFGYLAITQTQIVSLDINVQPKATVEKPADEVTLEDLKMTLAMTMFETKAQIEKRNSERNFEYIGMVFDSSGYDMKISDGGLVFEKEPPETTQSTDESEKADVSDTESAPVSEQTIEETFRSAVTQGNRPNRVMLNNQEVDLTGASFRDGVIRFMRDPSDFSETFSKYIPRIMFVMMPFTMFLGALFIRGRGNAFLYDHLVHAAYIHAIVFFLLLAGLILARFSFLPGGLIFLVFTTYLFFYLPLSLKHMFKRGPIKTVWATYCIAGIYLTVMFSILIYLSVMGMQNYLIAR